MFRAPEPTLQSGSSGKQWELGSCVEQFASVGSTTPDPVRVCRSSVLPRSKQKNRLQCRNNKCDHVQLRDHVVNAVFALKLASGGSAVVA
jgi:hypothetical protein